MTHKLMRVPYLLFSLSFLISLFLSYPLLLYNPLVAILVGRLGPLLFPSFSLSCLYRLSPRGMAENARKISRFSSYSFFSYPPTKVMVV